jgi:ankyrin repeat protein
VVQELISHGASLERFSWHNVSLTNASIAVRRVGAVWEWDDRFWCSDLDMELNSEVPIRWLDSREEDHLCAKQYKPSSKSSPAPGQILEPIWTLYHSDANVELITDYDYKRHEEYFAINPICVAARQGHVEVVMVLLKAGANAQDEAEALFQASKYGHLEVVKELLKSTTHEKEDLCVSLWSASENGHVTVVKALLEAGAVSQWDRDDSFYCDFVDCWEWNFVHRRHPLVLASENGHLEVVTEVLKSSAPDEDALVISLSFASREGHLEIVCALCQHNSEVL